jgi:hypothetical protein
MQKEDRIGTCTKCGMEFYVHAHHILPQAIFGKKNESLLTNFTIV